MSHHQTKPAVKYNDDFMFPEEAMTPRAYYQATANRTRPLGDDFLPLHQPSKAR